MSVLVMLAVLLALPVRALAQVPYQLLDRETEVRKLSFRFVDGQSFPVERLEQIMATSGMGAAPGLRRRLAFLPLITAPGQHPFSPLELQRDVARLRQYYASSGFLEPDIRYDVSLDREHNVVDVVMIIDEGRPLELATLDFRTADHADPADALPAELRPAWQRFTRDQQQQIGRRLGGAERTTIRRHALNWMTDRGYAFAETNTQIEVDSAAARVALTVVLEPGPRARIDSVAIEGNQQVEASVLRGTTALRKGDWFSASRLAEAQRRVFALDLFRVSLVDVPPQQRDSSVTVRLRVQENPPRLIGGEAGYSTEAGFTVLGHWAHRNFLGGARTFQVDATAQTGYQALDENPDRRYQLAVNVTQPAFLHPRMTLTVRPYAEYRDVWIDRSWEAGLETSLVYELGDYRFLSFQHRFTARRVLDYKVFAAGPIDLATLDALIRAGALDDIARRVDTSIFAVAGTIGRHDPTGSSRTLQARPTLEVAAPSALNTIEWARGDIAFIGHLPLTGRIGLDARAQFGRMLLFGSSTDRGDDPAAETLNAILLREVLFTAGGTGSVRGWGNRMLGPKWPDVQFIETDADSLRTEARGYLPLGGLSRILGSLELRLPFPGLGDSWGTHVFIDGARIGNFQGTLQPEASDAERGWFFGAGGGIDVATPVGPLRLSLGYKLNPSPLDLRRPGDVLEALLEDRPIESASVRSLQRLHLHISIGQSF